MRALSTSPTALVNLRFDKNFGFSPYGNICTCFPEIVYFSTRNMLPKTSKVFTCENGEDCLNLNGAKNAKLVDLEKGPSVAKMEIDTADNGPLRKNSTRFSSDFRVRLAANTATDGVLSTVYFITIIILHNKLKTYSFPNRNCE